ncbi:putative cytochrome P450 6a20 isoform X2 [Halictus rubicundus]|uniref:putative cytochrome P450 6a20 isoform X2 n=1 Tax=Halictus rubicundus TaxID=77578 RepID=UPI004036B2C5
MLLTSWLISNILGAAIFIITGLYIYYKLSVFTFWRKTGVYNMEPTFLVGNMMPLLTGKISYGEFFKNVYERNRKHRLVGIYMLHKPYLIVNDPDLIRNILTKEFANFHDRGVFCNPDTDPLSGNLVQMRGVKWRHLRIKLTPTFTSGKIKQIFPIMKETGDTLAKFLSRKAELKESIDVKDIFTRYSVDVIMSAAFGITCDSINNPNNECHFWAKRIFRPKPLWNSLIAFAPQVFDLFSMPYTERSVTKFFTTLFRDTVQYRESHNIVRKDFVNLLMQLMRDGYVDPDDDSVNQKADANIVHNKLTLAEATGQAYIFYLAGFETSSTTVTFCLYELAKHQDIQDKVRDEIRNAIKKHGDITYTALNDMPYLNKVTLETLRKYPALAFINRICTKERTLDTTNVTIPAGTSVVIPTYGLHWDPNIFPEPEKFDPERFSEENIKSRHPYVYLPFGEGPRICIGLRFGMVQVKVAVIIALLNHRIKFTPDTPDSLEYREMRGRSQREKERERRR